MSENAAKGAFALSLAAVGTYSHELIRPLIVLALVMLADWVTGLAEAGARGALCKRIGLIGIIKKVSYIFVVGVAIVVDFIIQTAAEKAGLDFGSIYMFGLLVTIWLILNECISILENVAEIGAPLPPFLVKLIGKLKKSAEDKGEDMVE